MIGGNAVRNEPMISVIIPVYNAGNFLKPAIESILHQTYKNFEIVLIDDGATDGSGSICDEFSAEYSNITVIHEKNSGISVARNTGIIHSRGQFITFCDHDDEYSPEYLEKAFSKICASNADLLKFNYKTIEIANGKRVESTIKGRADFMTIDLLLQNYMAFNQCIRALWNGIYKAEIIKKNNIFFDPFYRTGVEDYDFNLQYLQHCNTIQFLDDTLFFHYKRENQSADTRFSENKLESWIKMQKKEKLFLDKYGANDSMLLYSKVTYLLAIFNCLNTPACKWGILCKREYLKKYAKYSINHISTSNKVYKIFKKENFFKWIALYLFDKRLFITSLYYVKFKTIIWNLIHKKR